MHVYQNVCFSYLDHWSKDLVMKLGNSSINLRRSFEMKSLSFSAIHGVGNKAIVIDYLIASLVALLFNNH